MDFGTRMQMSILKTLIAKVTSKFLYNFGPDKMQLNNNTAMATNINQNSRIVCPSHFFTPFSRGKENRRINPSDTIKPDQPSICSKYKT